MTWSDYMKQHGQEEYAAWDAAVKPYTDRIAELEAENAALNKVLDIQRKAWEHVKRIEFQLDGQLLDFAEKQIARIDAARRPAH